MFFVQKESIRLNGQNLILKKATLPRAGDGTQNFSPDGCTSTVMFKFGQLPHMKRITCIILLFLSLKASAQDLAYARSLIDTLTSPYFWGRGYTNQGMKNAAEYLGKEMKSLGLLPLSGSGYFQSFSYPVNTFPGRMEVTINDRLLLPGTDYIISGESRGVRATGSFAEKDSATFVDQENAVVAVLEEKLTWSPAPNQAPYTVIELDKHRFNGKPATFKVNIAATLQQNFRTQNIAGYVRGTRNPDSFVVITAHYDHLGGMGDQTYFPGANDNASGTSMLLTLAKYYSANPQPYSMVFIAFAGEEIGLLGSKYYTEHPLFDLKKIRFLVNLDLVGTGDEGITVVNATEYKPEFDALTDINKQDKLLMAVNARSKAANSDHYWFTEKGVPAFFMYTLGGIKAYHDVFDRSATLPLTEYADLFKLIVKFNTYLQQR